jgi:hypothetical protein
MAGAQPWDNTGFSSCLLRIGNTNNWCVPESKLNTCDQATWTSLTTGASGQQMMVACPASTYIGRGE